MPDNWNENRVLNILSSLKSQVELLKSNNTDEVLLIADGESMIVDLLKDGNYSRWEYSNLSSYQGFFEEIGIETTEIKNTYSQFHKLLILMDIENIVL